LLCDNIVNIRETLIKRDLEQIYKEENRERKVREIYEKNKKTLEVKKNERSHF